MAEPKPKRQPRDVSWDLSALRAEDGVVKSWEALTVILLNDIREELKKLNKTLTEASIFVNGKVG